MFALVSVTNSVKISLMGSRLSEANFKMPILTIKTNADQAKFDTRFFNNLTEYISEHCGINPDVSKLSCADLEVRQNYRWSVE